MSFVPFWRNKIAAQFEGYHMRNWLVLALIFWSTALFAQTKDELCAQMGVLAKEIMLIRQEGAAMSLVMNTIVPKDDEQAAKIVRQLIISAYEKPKFSTEKVKEGVVADFRNEAELACFKGLKEE
jgi:hypothetical protein